MKTIPKETVIDVWPGLLHSSERLQEALLAMSSTQPILFERLTSVDRGLIPASHRGLLVIYGVLIWRIMSETGKRKSSPVIPRGVWESTVAKNVHWFYALTEDSPVRVLDAAETAMEECRQGPLLSIVTRALVKEAEHRRGMSDERLEMVLVHLKSVVDCLDRPKTRTRAGSEIPSRARS